MGCPSSDCKGYELTGDLDFDTNGNGQADAGDTYWNERPFSYSRSYGRGWIPLGERTTKSAVGFAAVFDGNGHVIHNLYVNGFSDSAWGCSAVLPIPALFATSGWNPST